MTISSATVYWQVDYCTGLLIAYLPVHSVVSKYMEITALNVEGK